MKLHAKEFKDYQQLTLFINERLRLNSYQKNQEFQIVSINNIEKADIGTVGFVIFYLEYYG